MAELIQTKWGYNGHLSDVILGNMDLIVGANKVNLGKDGFTSQIGCKILDMRNGVAIRSCDVIQPVVVSAPMGAIAHCCLGP